MDLIERTYWSGFGGRAGRPPSRSDDEPIPATEDAWLGHVGRVQSVFADGTVEGTLRETLSPESTHVFLSGNPKMVEHMHRLFLQRGYSLHSARTAGSLHVERYW